MRFGSAPVAKLLHRTTVTLETFTANDAKTRCGEFIDGVQRAPVRVTRHDRVVGVMVSANDCEAMRACYANRLQTTLDEAGRQAVAAGLTAEVLSLLLAGDN